MLSDLGLNKFEIMLENYLQNEIYSHVGQFGREPTLIIMHPQTWVNLRKEVLGYYGGNIYRHSLALRYQGIRVLRSLDMVDGLFEVR